jgi:hypothetical protein
LNGSGNKLDFRNAAEGLFAAGATVDNGANNNVTISLMASPGTGGQPSRVVAASPTRTPGFVGSRTPDFAMGNPSTPYYNNQDLLFYPRDYKFNGSPYAIVTDATSFSGRYVAITASDASRGFTAFQATGGTPVVGQNVPASVITIYETAKCPVQTSYTLNVRNSVSGTPIGTGTFPCTTTYTTNSIVADLSTHNGESLWINWTGVTNEVDSAMIVITPYSVSATPGKNTVPKTVAASTTLDPGWLPFPASATIGGVKAQTCTGVNHVLGVNTDGSLNCTPDSGGGTTVNTMGCLQGFDTTPCVIAKVGTTYSNTVSSSTTTWYTNATGGPIHVRFTGIAHPTVVGTAGTMQLQLGVPSASNQCAGNGSITLTATTTKTTSSANTNGCLVTLQNGESLTWTLVLTGATGTPTVEVFAYAERME